jgi:NAD(P)-dependent dehydrogenase (short-subunit alcohol dehydrogenase family)
MQIATLRFTSADQQAFARLSGDFNPIHLDPVAARRVAAGAPIVHGINLLLRALDAHFRDRAPTARVTVRATFRRPALPGDSIAVVRTAARRLALTVDGAAPIVEIGIERGPRAPHRIPAECIVRTPSLAKRPLTRPRAHTWDEIERAHGTLRLAGGSAIRRAFPHVCRALGGEAVAAVAAISRLVGMECPGRDSLLSAVRLDVTVDAAATRLRWRVAGADPRFGKVRIEIDSECLCASVDAFVRPCPAPLPSIDAVAARISPGELAGHRALIVGGSRGIGAATALIVAAGGGVPLVTFAAGSAEARALRRDALGAGRRIEMMRFDVLDESFDQLARAARRFGATHLYYFATPRIFARRREPFDDELFRRFAAFYVIGFARTCAAVANGPLAVFFPSSTALDESRRELAEYVAAKSAGEALAATLPAALPGVQVLVRRLARIATDQTASIVPSRALDPVDAMLPVVREMHRMIGGRR